MRQWHLRDYSPITRSRVLLYFPRPSCLCRDPPRFFLLTVFPLLTKLSLSLILSSRVAKYQITLSPMRCGWEMRKRQPVDVDT